MGEHCLLVQLGLVLPRLEQLELPNVRLELGCSMLGLGCSMMELGYSRMELGYSRLELVLPSVQIGVVAGCARGHCRKLGILGIGLGSLQLGIVRLVDVGEQLLQMQLSKQRPILKTF